ncbi:hypothetical protein ACIBXA_16705 [Micromonospora echinaurantiaca]|uniref:hypothetical protein n=1 Tax=Micromonospora echinaurantiaca TaxID=47857 RepID=UPI00378AE782
MRILLLSTADTDLLAARASGADYRLANPARVAADHHRLDQIAAVPLTHLTTHPRDRAGRVPA